MNKLHKNIVLTGLSGSGKTTIGKLLVKEFNNFKFVDTDEIIEKQENRTINEIFSTNGEDFFRELETKTVKQISNQNNLIISTGGGIILKEINTLLLKENGIIFYLKVSPENLAERLKNKTDRPLLNNTDMTEKLTSMLRIRTKFYEQADVILETGNISVEQTVKEIKRIYNERSKS